MTGGDSPWFTDTVGYVDLICLNAGIDGTSIGAPRRPPTSQGPVPKDNQSSMVKAELNRPAPPGLGQAKQHPHHPAFTTGLLPLPDGACAATNRPGVPVAQQTTLAHVTVPFTALL